MKTHTLALGELGANCHILETAEKHAVAFDIGGDTDRLLAFLREQDLTLQLILLTHGHFDHINGVYDVQQATGAPVYVHALDAHMLTSAVDSLAEQVGASCFFPVRDFHTLTKATRFTVDECTITVLHTPGHTAGSVCYLCGSYLFSGDTLFCRSVGRTDFPTGSTAQMRESLHKLGALTEDYTVLPGHMQATTLAEEKAESPYLRAEH